MEEPTLHPIFQSLARDAFQHPPPQESQSKPKPKPSGPRHVFSVSRQRSRQDPIWSSAVPWSERVCRLALPDAFESDRTYARVPGAACLDDACCSRDAVVVGLYVDPLAERGSSAAGLYVVHGCTRCGLRWMLARE